MIRQKFISKGWNGLDTERSKGFFKDNYKNDLSSKISAMSINAMTQEKQEPKKKQKLKNKIQSDDAKPEKTIQSDDAMLKKEEDEKVEDKTLDVPVNATMVPQVTITCPMIGIDNNHDDKKQTNIKSSELYTPKANGSNLAGRRAVPDITITCPPIESFDSFDQQFFTKRKYMVCRESPRSGKKKTSVVNFPEGLSSFDAEIPDSPRSFIDSPVPYSCIDLAFTYNGSLNSPFTPPMSPLFANRKPSLYPSPVPVFKLEDSFPPAEFEQSLRKI